MSNPKRSGNPATRASPQPVEPAGTGSSPVHDRSRAVLVRLARLPKLVVPAAMLACMLIGLTAPLPVALVALALVVAFVAWLALLSWPVLDVKGKFVRGLMLGLVVGSGVGRVNGWL